MLNLFVTNRALVHAFGMVFVLILTCECGHVISLHILAVNFGVACNEVSKPQEETLEAVCLVNLS